MSTESKRREVWQQEICDRLDVALFGEHMSGTRWINASMRLDYLIQVAHDMRHSILYLRKENQVLQQSWKESLNLSVDEEEVT